MMVNKSTRGYEGFLTVLIRNRVLNFWSSTVNSRSVGKIAGFGFKIGKGFWEAGRTPHPIFLGIPYPPM